MHDRFASRRGALLLEVIVAMTILVASLAMIGAQLRGGVRNAIVGEELLQGSMLADRLAARLELDLALQQQVFDEQTREDDFGDQYPRWFWRLEIEPLIDQEAPVDNEIEDDPAAPVFEISLEILYQDDPLRPDDISDARVVRQVRMLKAAPTQIDLERDYGMAEEQIAQLQELMPNLDPENVNPQELIDELTRDPETMMTMMADILPLMQTLAAGGLSGTNGQQLDMGQLQQMMTQFGIDPSAVPGGIPGLEGLPGNLPEGIPGADGLRDQILDQINRQGGGSRTPTRPGRNDRTGNNNGPPASGDGNRNPRDNASSGEGGADDEIRNQIEEMIQLRNSGSR